MAVARILVVDDSADVRLALSTILEDAGHEVIEAEDGDQVFDLALQKKPPTLHDVEGADHGLTVRGRDPVDVTRELVDVTRRWIARAAALR